MNTLFEKNGGKYEMQGDYKLPCVALPQDTTEHIGVWGERHRRFLNLELKQILDVVATFIMEDDSGLLIDAYNTTEIGETDCTRISIMDKNRFPRWIKEREKSLKTISDF